MNRAKTLLALLLVSTLLTTAGCIKGPEAYTKDNSHDTESHSNTDESNDSERKIARLNIRINLDKSEPERLGMELSVVNNGNIPVRNVTGTMSFQKEGGEEIGSKDIDFPLIQAGKGESINTIYSAEKGETYYIELKLETDAGPVHERYKITY